MPVRIWKTGRWLPLAVLGLIRQPERYTSEVAEHICNSEPVSIAREIPTGTSRMIDQDPARVLEVVDRLPGALCHWVIEHAITALNDAAPELSREARAPTADPPAKRVSRATSTT